MSCMPRVLATDYGLLATPRTGHGCFVIPLADCGSFSRFASWSSSLEALEVESLQPMQRIHESGTGVHSAGSRSPISRARGPSGGIQRLVDPYDRLVKFQPIRFLEFSAMGSESSSDGSHRKEAQ